ncbi:hypothetical protein GALL_195550 [mine drainage metagenome]|uniref:Chemoreceptor zinc-binding domain-containing protein n=1 Tax=mine drainage metagenome TaxID=410659 RepID=A0A1J5RR15_9ZZZZ
MSKAPPTPPEIIEIVLNNHADYIGQLIEYAEAGTVNAEIIATVRSDSLCRIGQWLQKLLASHAGDESFARLCETHKAFHHHAADLLSGCGCAGGNGAARYLKQLHALDGGAFNDLLPPLTTFVARLSEAEKALF